MTKVLSRLRLHHLILFLALSGVLVTLGNAYVASYRAQRELLIANTLEANRVYAAKLADMTDQFFRAAQRQLAYSAALLSGAMTDGETLDHETKRLLAQSDTFNSVAVVDATGKVLANAPQSLGLVGRIVHTDGVAEALAQRRPLITGPYNAATDRLILLISQPIFSAAGSFQGFIGAAIYLKEKNGLQTQLGEHYYRDGSYLYVVDGQGRLIYHPDPSRIGERVRGNPAIDAVTAGQAGSRGLVNSRGVPMLTGYAPVPVTGWGIVSQRPLAATLTDLEQQMRGVFWDTSLVVALTALLIGIFAMLIARPLRKLAGSASRMDADSTLEHLAQVHSWYYEAAMLKRGLLKGMGLMQERIGRLNKESLTDPLTGLYNRRGMQLMLEGLEANEKPFAVVALDIDHFKQVNDNFGHDLGDEVLRVLAEQMRQASRQGDILCRSGGEEFLMLLPDCAKAGARELAERLRQQVAALVVEQVRFTLSLGVAVWPGPEEPVKAALKAADQALYQAKGQGRDQVVVSAGS
ncbi:sensor domain-containing diguanylate cyclase [Gallaecimonas kandeliae]|uniref:GGDEF domain-containing protein n=1 Tax=Gallaecimonas kandeliae TaxID=3029055 RepID=UPI002647E0A2|nr:sensor domain-containing diguanylate cyclase [Gallaecimonas kandeliae]WKE67003.1 sensor domain-containing diguanylate cyclase [Gallaecimonas kandeliae]